MPVLMNKGDNPREAAWLFYTDRESLSAWGSSIVEGRYDSGMLACEAQDVECAKKASSEIPVYLQVSTLVPEDFDIEAARGEIVDRATAALECLKQQQEQGEEPENAQAASEGEPETSGEESAQEPEAQDDDPFDYEPVPAPEGLRLRVGTTTRQAALSYLLPVDDGEGRDTSLPDLQMLAQLIDFMRDSEKGLPAMAVWHIDPSGVLRMVPASKVKAMAGNVLNVKR